MASPSDPVDNFADLFNLDETDESVEGTPAPVEEEKAPAPRKQASRSKTRAAAAEPQETAEQARIRELEAALAEPMPRLDADEEEETPEKARIKELEDALARRNAKIAEDSPTLYAAPRGPGEHILIHFINDGFVALGETWYRGQELEFVVGTPGYEQTKDRTGKSWVDLAGDIAGQIQRWGRQQIALGEFIPNRGEKFDDELAAKDRRRRRSVPIMR